MFKLDRFSNKTYLTTGDIKTNSSGDVFVKAGDDYVADNGDYIKKVGSNYLNTRTGIDSTFGDPFGDDDE